MSVDKPYDPEQDPNDHFNRAHAEPPDPAVLAEAMRQAGEGKPLSEYVSENREPQSAHNPLNSFEDIDAAISAWRSQSVSEIDICNDCRGPQPHSECGNNPDTCQCCYETVVDL